MNKAWECIIVLSSILDIHLKSIFLTYGAISTLQHIHYRKSIQHLLKGAQYVSKFILVEVIEEDIKSQHISWLTSTKLMPLNRTLHCAIIVFRKINPTRWTIINNEIYLCVFFECLVFDTFHLNVISSATWSDRKITPREAITRVVKVCLKQNQWIHHFPHLLIHLSWYGQYDDDLWFEHWARIWVHLL